MILFFTGGLNYRMDKEEKRTGERYGRYKSDMFCK